MVIFAEPSVEKPDFQPTYAASGGAPVLMSGGLSHVTCSGTGIFLKNLG
jgi:hypothetical protein